VQEGKVARVAKLVQAGLLLRPRLLHNNNNRNREPSNGEDRAASRGSDPAEIAQGPAGGNWEKEEKEDKAENEDRAESKALTRATSSDSPRAQIPREQARRNLKTTPKGD